MFNEKIIYFEKRNFEILPFFVGKTIKVHNGKSYDQIVISKKMVGHKVGEFSRTKKPFKFKKKNK